MINLRTNCELYLAMNENADNYNVSSLIGSITGTASRYTSTMHTDGKVDGGFEFLGRFPDYYLTLSSKITLTEPYTIAFFYRDYYQGETASFCGEQVGNSKIQYFDAGATGYIIFWNDAGESLVYNRSDFPTGDDTWHSVLLTSVGGIQKMERDNITIFPFANNWNTAGISIDIIGAKTASLQNIVCDLDLFGLWSRALEFFPVTEQYLYSQGTEILSTIPRAIHHYKQMAR
ncbi:hypothetical protein ACFL3G_07620 [Planctomycetota bacterium]